MGFLASEEGWVLYRSREGYVRLAIPEGSCGVEVQHLEFRVLSFGPNLWDSAQTFGARVWGASGVTG